MRFEVERVECVGRWKKNCSGAIAMNVETSPLSDRMRDNSRLTRRRWMGRTAAVGLSASLGWKPGIAVGDMFEDEGESGMPIIDTHQHLWDLDRFRLPWVDGEPKLAKNFGMAEYRRATEGLNVVKTIYMEVDLDPAQQDDEAEFVIETCRRGDTPMVAGVISGRPAEEARFRDYITKYRGNPFIKGVRQVLHRPDTPPGHCLQPEYVRSVRLLGELDMSFDVCLRPTDLGDAAKLAAACPNTRLILDHCGNPNVQIDLQSWRRQIAEIARHENFICKVSGFIVTAPANGWDAEMLAPVVDHVLEEFGPDRVVFGGDWPVCTLTASLAEWTRTLASIVANRPDTVQRKLFHDNAVVHYRLGNAT